VSDTTFSRIFKNGSKTYFYSSLFFPPEVKIDVFVLYSFVRTADNFVDSLPAQTQDFKEYSQVFYQAWAGEPAHNEIIDAYVELAQRREFPLAWTTSFLAAMNSDLTVKTYATLSDLDEYIYGSAEVIGLMMAKILSLPTESYESARFLGKSMQYINFLRDIAEDITLGRTYIPADILSASGLNKLTKEEAALKPQAFNQLVKQEVARYEQWHHQATLGFKYIPKRYLIPIKTAADMYQWTAIQLAENPRIIFDQKVKPSVSKIVSTIAYNTFTL